MTNRTRASRIEREPIRETTREKPARAEILGRDGKPLSRRRGGNTDQFAFDRTMIPDGWDYEWKSYTVEGQEQVAHQTNLMQDGWTPVPADRHAGLFMAPGAKGAIIRGGLMLMERPIELTKEAREEDRYRANRQLNDQKNQFGMGVPDGFTGRPATVNTTYQPSDVARPALPIE